MDPDLAICANVLDLQKEGEEEEREEVMPRWMRYLPKKRFPKHHRDIPVDPIDKSVLTDAPVAASTKSTRSRRERVVPSSNAFGPMTERALLATKRKRRSISSTNVVEVGDISTDNLTSAPIIGESDIDIEDMRGDLQPDQCPKKRRRRPFAADSRNIAPNMLEVSALLNMSTLH